MATVEEIWDAVKAKVQAVTNIQHVFEGVPESIGEWQVATMTLGSIDEEEAAAGLVRVEMAIEIGFVYLLRDAEADAERLLMQNVQQFRTIMRDDKKLGGIVDGTTTAFNPENDVPYRDLNEVEYRVYPVIVTARYRETFNPDQGR